MNILILIARANYEGSDYQFMTAKHYYVNAGDARSASDAIDSFRKEITENKIEIKDMLAYVLIEEDLKKAAV
jgi:predicted trehalose synthase